MLRVTGEAPGDCRSNCPAGLRAPIGSRGFSHRLGRHDATVPDQGKLWVELGALLKTGDGGGMASFGAEFDRHFEAT